MKINFVKKTEHPILFREIGAGTCFSLDIERRYGIENANIYMKIPHCIPVDSNGCYDTDEPINAVNLRNGEIRFTEDDDEIIPIPASLNAEAL